jgi:hypothetical protein
MSLSDEPAELTGLREGRIAVQPSGFLRAGIGGGTRTILAGKQFPLFWQYPRPSLLAVGSGRCGV